MTNQLCLPRVIERIDPDAAAARSLQPQQPRPKEFDLLLRCRTPLPAPVVAMSAGLQSPPPYGVVTRYGPCSSFTSASHTSAGASQKLIHPRSMPVPYLITRRK